MDNAFYITLYLKPATIFDHNESYNYHKADISAMVIFSLNSSSNYLSSMIMEMTHVCDELNEEMDSWCQNRSDWVNDRVKECIDQRRSSNKNYRHMRKICGVDDVRTKHIKIRI